jgi:uncharacterized protein (DUF488 family)
MQAIFQEQLKTLAARDDLFVLVEAIRSGRAACLLCLEASAEHCHRRMVASAVEAELKIRVVDLQPELTPLPPPRRRT